MSSVQGQDNTLVPSASAAAPSVGEVGKAILPALALAQFLASYANTSLNVSISAITKDLGTTVTAVQTSITLFTLVMDADDHRQQAVRYLGAQADVPAGHRRLRHGLGHCSLCPGDGAPLRRLLAAARHRVGAVDP